MEIISRITGSLNSKLPWWVAYPRLNNYIVRPFKELMMLPVRPVYLICPELFENRWLKRNKYHPNLYKTEKYVNKLAKKMGHKKHIRVYHIGIPHDSRHPFSPAAASSTIVLPTYWLKDVSMDQFFNHFDSQFENDLLEAHMKLAKLGKENYDFVIGHEIMHIINNDCIRTCKIKAICSIVGFIFIFTGHPLLFYLHLVTFEWQTNMLSNAIRAELLADKGSIIRLGINKNDAAHFFHRYDSLMDKLAQKYFQHTAGDKAFLMFVDKFGKVLPLQRLFRMFNKLKELFSSHPSNHDRCIAILRIGTKTEEQHLSRIFYRIFNN